MLRCHQSAGGPDRRPVESEERQCMANLVRRGADRAGRNADDHQSVALVIGFCPTPGGTGGHPGLVGGHRRVGPRRPDRARPPPASWPLTPRPLRPGAAFRPAPDRSRIAELSELARAAARFADTADAVIAWA